MVRLRWFYHQSVGVVDLWFGMLLKCRKKPRYGVFVSFITDFFELGITKVLKATLTNYLNNQSLYYLTNRFQFLFMLFSSVRQTHINHSRENLQPDMINCDGLLLLHKMEDLKQ